MVATATGQSLMTAEEFYAWAELPENEDRHHELENGVPVEMPPPSKPHGGICFLVAHMLGLYLLPRGGSVFTNDTGLIVRRRPDTVRGPDVMAYLTRERIGHYGTATKVRIPADAKDISYVASPLCVPAYSSEVI